MARPVAESIHSKIAGLLRQKATYKHRADQTIGIGYQPPDRIANPLARLESGTESAANANHQSTAMRSLEPHQTGNNTGFA